MSGSDRGARFARLEGPVYVDTSAAVKLYVPEPESPSVDRILRGRTDLLVSDLTVSELASALGRRRREGTLEASVAARIYRRFLSDLSDGLFLRVELTSEVHREAERMLLASPLLPLRTLDALHLASAATHDARTILTFDLNLARAAASFGLLTAPSLSVGD